MKIRNKNLLYIFVGLSGIFLFFLFFIFLYSRQINFIYKVSTPLQTITVLSSNHNQNEKSLKVDFMLKDLKKLNFLNENVTTIEDNFYNKNKDLSEVISMSQNLYINFFNENNIIANYIYNNKYLSDQSFYLKTYIEEKTNLKIIYNKFSNEIVFVIPKTIFSVNGERYQTKNNSFFIFKDIESGSIVKIGNKTTQLNDNILNNFFISINDLRNTKIKIFKPTSSNLLSTTTASFENGLWQTVADDCSNKIDGKPEIDLEESSDASSGEKAIKLFSKNHYACISKTFPIQIKEDKLYQLSFDYKNITGKDVRYYYKLRSEKNNKSLNYAFLETIQAEDNNWHTFSTIINPKIVKENFVHPEYIEEEDGFDADLFLNEGISDFYSGDPIEDIKFIDIFFYAPSDGSKEIINLYDNVRLVKYELAEIREIDLKSILDTDIILAENIFLQQGENKFEYIIDDKNLLDAEIASFESGLWQKEVGDCSNSKPGEPKIDLKESSDTSDGKIATKLSSKNHYACTSKTFSINLSDGKLYKLQFDYKNIKGEKIMYYYNLRSDEKQNTHPEMIKTKNNNWNIYETIIDPEISGVKYFNIYFYAPSDGKEEVINLYDNVRLTEYLPKDIDSYYLHAEQEVDETPKLKSVEYKAINRWKNKVVLHSVNNSFLLVYPEKYSEKWKVYQTEPKVHKVIKSIKSFENYFVPKIESNRQATKQEVKEFIFNNLISAVGDKFISKNFDGSIRNDNISNGRFYDSWFKKSIAEDIHFQVNNYSNAWWIDINQAKNYTKNPDGTYDMELIIENKMLKWFYLGLLISGLTLLGCIFYLIYDFLKTKIWRKK